MKVISKNKNYKNFINDKKSATWPPTPMSIRCSFCFSIITIRTAIRHYCSITCVGTLSLYSIWTVFTYTIIFIATIIYSERAKRIKAVHFFLLLFFYCTIKLSYCQKFFMRRKNCPHHYDEKIHNGEQNSRRNHNE